MSLAAPTALFLLALAVPIVGLYILKVRLRRVPVSTNLFWKQIYEEKPPRSIWQYLRHLMSLMLQLLMLALLVFAVADPYLPWQLTQARRVVLVVDQSASMQAADVEPSRFAAAIEAAHEYVDGLRDRDEMAIVLAGARPEVAVGMNGHVPTLRRALDALVPSDGPTHIEPAIDLGRKLIGDHPKGQIVLLSDGCVPPTDPLSPEAPADVASQGGAAAAPDAMMVESRVFATPAPNVGITQFQVRRSLVDPLGYAILVHVKNASERPAHCRLEIEMEDLPVDILPLELEPEELWTRSIEKTSMDGGRLKATLTQIAENRESPGTDTPAKSPNSLSVDDIAWAVLPPREIQKVLVVTPGNLFLQKVFEANPLVAIETRRDLPDQWPADTLIVLHQQVPETVPPGNVFVIDPSESTDLWTLGEELLNPIVTEQDTDSPLMTHVRLDNVLMPRARKIAPAGRTRVLAGSVSGDPIYTELLRDNGKCLLLTVSLEESDLAFRTAFPIMASNALGWFAGTSGELNRSLATGEAATLAVPLAEGLTSQALRVANPDGEMEEIAFRTAPDGPGGDEASQSMPERSGNVTIGPLNRVGVYEVIADAVDEAERPPLALAAANLSDERETDLRPPEGAAADVRQASLAGWLSRPVWFYLAAIACLLTVTEWFLYNRRFVD